MKKLMLILLFLLPSLFALGQEDKDDDREQLRQLIQNSFDKIFSELDTSSIQQFYTDDFLLLENGEVWDNDKVKAYMLRASASDNRPVRTNRFDFIEVKIRGNTAWLAYHNYATLTFKNGESRELYWLESATAVKDEEGWRLDMLHSTRVDPKK
ncbi:MAG: nuclear transport factor 2 family protein [Cyclobacteriaceae bacterium]